MVDALPRYGNAPPRRSAVQQTCRLHGQFASLSAQSRAKTDGNAPPPKVTNTTPYGDVPDGRQYGDVPDSSRSYSAGLSARPTAAATTGGYTRPASSMPAPQRVVLGKADLQRSGIVGSVKANPYADNARPPLQTSASLPNLAPSSTSPRGFACRICQRVYPTAADLAQHTKLRHK